MSPIRSRVAPLLFVAALVVGCSQEPAQEEASTTTPPANPAFATSAMLTDQVVDAGCGICQMGMKGYGCELAVKVGDHSYYVTGAKAHEDDPHAPGGTCLTVRKAKVSGKVEGDKFVATAIALLPLDE